MKRDPKIEGKFAIICKTEKGKFCAFVSEFKTKKEALKYIKKLGIKSFDILCG